MGAVAVRFVDWEAARWVVSVTETVMVQLPAVVGVHARDVTFWEAHPLGNPA